MSAAPKTSRFETRVCSRCGGSGEYSFNPRHLTMCYGCRGTGRQYTKAGAAAAALLTEKLSVMAAELQPGQQVRWTCVTRACEPYRVWLTVAAVDINVLQDGSNNWLVTFEKNNHLDWAEVAGNERVLVRWPAEVKEPFIQECLAYQAGLILERWRESWKRNRNPLHRRDLEAKAAALKAEFGLE